MTDIDEIQKKLKAWFANNFERETFKTSLGEQDASKASMKVTMSFFAHGIAMLGVLDPRYLSQLVSLHEQLKNLCKTLEGHPLGRFDNAYYFSLIAGSIIEFAVEAVHKVAEAGDG